MSRKTPGTPATTRRRVAVGTAILSVTALLSSGALAVGGNPPTVTKFEVFGQTAAVGPLAGGSTVVEVGGTNLDEVTNVFFGATPATKILKESDTKLFVTPPAGSAGAVAVKIGTGSQTHDQASDVLGAGTDYTYTAGPVVSTVTVSGKDMTIDGTQFTGATAVLVGDNLTKIKPAQITGDTKITLRTPSVKGGAVDVSVITPLGIGTKAGAFGAVPVISKIVLGSETDLRKAKAVTSASAATGTVATGEPTTAAAQRHTAATGTVVIITGSGFSGLTSLKFGTSDAAFVVVNDGALRARIPANLTAPDPKNGQLKVDVVAARGDVKSKAAKFTYVAVPVVTAIDDVTGATGTVNTFTITGKGLYGAKVTLGGKTTKVTSATDTTVSVSTAKTPTTGEVEIKLTTPNGFAAITPKYTFVATASDTKVPANN